MKYKLKDEKLAEHFRAIYSLFDKELNDACEDELENSYDYVLVEVKRYCEAFDVLYIAKSEIEFAYNPNDWNQYPEINPPYGVPMRIEYKDKLGVIRRTCGFFFSPESDEPDFWIDFNGNKIEFKKLKFRPWED